MLVNKSFFFKYWAIFSQHASLSLGEKLGPFGSCFNSLESPWYHSVTDWYLCIKWHPGGQKELKQPEKATITVPGSSCALGAPALSTITAQTTAALSALLLCASRSPTAPETISRLQSQWPGNWSLKAWEYREEVRSLFESLHHRAHVSGEG